MTRNYYVIGSVAFVPHPLAHGLWFKTDPSVVKAHCPQCHSPAGVPCRSLRRSSTDPLLATFTAATHYWRRIEGRKYKLAGNGDVVVVTSRDVRRKRRK